MPLIALVHTLVMVGEERRVIAPGQPLPELPAHDATALVAAGMAADPALDAVAAAAQAAHDAEAAQDFAAAQERQRLARQSTAEPEPEPEPAAPAKKPKPAKE
ncbi:MAG: hypothetical protein JSR53_11815 [Proteobacteria bacterium]|nr:hypothetical protein [Pseudomonadota bacterium]